MSKSHYFHDVGGSMPPNHPTYIERDADNQLFDKLNEGQLCYVLNARQMGKSSLRQRIMEKLRKEKKVKCAYIDMGTLNEGIFDQERWYFLFILQLNSSFSVNLLFEEQDLFEWWYDEQNKILPPSLRLDKFIEDKLLVKIKRGKVIIFLDEIDSLLAINFKDNFLGFIRSCYDKRPEKNEYKRLVFCLLGAIAPSDLIQNRQQAFNIGIEIELTGLEQSKVENSFIFGLEEIVENPQSILNEIFEWTGGQPFLTQQLCQLVVDKAENGTVDINTLIQEHIIDNWERSQEHFKYIRNNLIKGDKHPFFLLALLRKIIKGEVVYYEDKNSSHVTLKTLGLININKNKIVPFNKLYCKIFNADWIDKKLSSLTQKQWQEIPNFLDSSRNSLAHISEFINDLVKPLIPKKFIYIIIFFILIDTVSLFGSYYWFTCDTWKEKFDYRGNGVLIELIRYSLVTYFFYYFIGDLFKKEAEDVFTHYRYLWIRILAIIVAIIFTIYDIIYNLYIGPKDLNHGQFSLRVCVLPYLFYLPAALINTILIGIPFIVVTVYSSFIKIYEYAKKILSCYSFINEMNEEAQVLVSINSVKENIKYIIKSKFYELFQDSTNIFTIYFIFVLSLLLMFIFEFSLGYHTLSEKGQAVTILYYSVVFISIFLIFILGLIGYEINFRNTLNFLLKIKSDRQDFKSQYNTLKLIRRIMSRIARIPFTYIFLFSAILLLVVKPLG